jgi:methionine synthase II (cobalamin-independent)
MKIDFKPGALPAWIGSLPLDSHRAAAAMMMQYSPDIPIWIQLPHFKKEGMMAQFLPGMPGVVTEEGRTFIRTDGDKFDREFLAFFEEYMDIMEDAAKLDRSRFSLTRETAPGFFELLNTLDALSKSQKQALAAVKGQVTGPFTFATGVVDQNKKAIFYNDQLRDAAVRLIALKARWQVRQFEKYQKPVILFLDEPGLTGFGSSAFISVSREDVAACLEEVVAAVHAEGALAGIHVCANAEWPVILESSADIVSFDAYSFFDKFILYPEQIKRFIEKDGIIAWGIVPTGDAAAVEAEDVASLLSRWEDEVGRLETIGIDRSAILRQSLITPSCGTGSLPLAAAEKVVRMNKELSEKIRAKYKSSI